MKYILRVPRSASNSVTLAELGRFPLTVEIIKNKVKYYCRLESMGQTNMLEKVFQASKLKFNRLEKIVSFIKKETNCTNLITDFNDKCQVYASVREIDQHMIKYYKKMFFLSLRSEENANCIIRDNR